MKKLNREKVYTGFRDGVTVLEPVIGRRYTMTHSDETAELFVTIGEGYAEDKVIPLRDEVRLGFERQPEGIVLMGEVLVSGDGVMGRTEHRNAIFTREMPLALQAIRYADRILFQTNPKLDQIPVLIWFRSDEPEYDKIYDYGTMSEYK